LFSLRKHFFALFFGSCRDVAIAASVCRRCDGGVERRTNVSNSGVLVTVAACAKRNIAGKIRRILVRRRRSGA
jgi:hypothetical protein